MIPYTGAWLYGVHILCAKMAAVSHGTMHVTTKQHRQHTTLVDVKQRAILFLFLRIQAFIQNHMQYECSEPA